MHFIINRDAFVEGLTSVSQVVPVKSTLPILSNLKIQTGEGKIILSATDLNIGIETSAVAEILEPGAITIPAKRLNEIVRQLPNSPVEFTVSSDHQVVVKCKKSVFNLVGLSAEEYPKFPVFEKGKTIEIATDKFFRMVHMASFAVSTDEMRMQLNGIYWRVTPENLLMVSTDGHRLVKIIEHQDAENPIVTGDLNISVIVPPKALVYAGKLLINMERINISVDERFIILQVADFTIFSRLIDGKYVDFDQVIPVTNQHIVKVNRENLLNAVRRVAILSNQLTHQINFFLRPDLIQLAVNTPDLGQADDEVEVEYANEDMDIGYNAQYLIDMLSHLDTEYVFFELNSSTTAGLIKPEKNLEGETLTLLIMPIRLND